MNRFCAHPFLRLAVIGVAVAAIGLAACGRKGPLDPPPGASLAGEPQAHIPSLMRTPATPIGGQTQNNDPGVDADGKPQAPSGPKKSIPLDVLLN